MTRAQYVANNLKSLRSTQSNSTTALNIISGLVYDSMKHKGIATNAALAALTLKSNGDTYRIITAGGTLNAGALTTVVGSIVTYDETNSLWVLFTAV